MWIFVQGDSKKLLEELYCLVFQSLEAGKFLKLKVFDMLVGGYQSPVVGKGL